LLSGIKQVLAQEFAIGHDGATGARGIAGAVRLCDAETGEALRHFSFGDL